jgi:hypothetical protein
MRVAAIDIVIIEGNWNSCVLKGVSDQSLSPTGDTSDAQCCIDLVFRAESGSISLHIINGLDEKEDYRSSSYR